VRLIHGSLHPDSQILASRYTKSSRFCVTDVIGRLHITSLPGCRSHVTVIVDPPRGFRLREVGMRDMWSSLKDIQYPTFKITIFCCATSREQLHAFPLEHGRAGQDATTNFIFSPCNLDWRLRNSSSLDLTLPVPVLNGQPKAYTRQRAPLGTIRNEMVASHPSRVFFRDVFYVAPTSHVIPYWYRFQMS